MINIKKNYYIEIEISLLTKSGSHYSSSLNPAIFRSANCRDWEKNEEIKYYSTLQYLSPTYEIGKIGSPVLGDH
jgi:hypothetical protein